VELVVDPVEPLVMGAAGKRGITTVCTQIHKHTADDGVQ